VAWWERPRSSRKAGTPRPEPSSAAVAAAFAGENLRALAVEKSVLPNPGVAVVEDAVVLFVGSRATSKVVR
jgi:hypothetical protein